jgi:CDP-glucose 4,6-dehydratase
MEDLVTDTRLGLSLPHLRGVRVLVTGHTGFKGAWLSEWLLQAGAHVFGVALPPASPDVLFSVLRHDERLNHAVCDIRDYATLADTVRQADPEIIFHLAAQALVRRSYREPLLTWETNVGGTLNVLEAARSLARPCTVIAVTTDKVYKNHEWEFAYREVDELGGHDPYSASKAACELAVASWRSSFAGESGVRVTTARAGNVIGGGDTSEDRIVPDCFRAWSTGQTVELRHPHSTRPWQHVLEPLSGYLALAADARTSSAPLEACNFGPGVDGDRSVEELVRTLAAFDSNRQWVSRRSTGQHEARALSLSIDRARHKLNWRPLLSFDEAVSWTNDGYLASPRHVTSVVERQIAAYASRAGTSLA